MPLKPATITIITANDVLTDLRLPDPDFNTGLITLQKLWLENKDAALDKELKEKVGSGFNLYLTHLYPKTQPQKGLDAAQKVNDMMALLHQNSVDLIQPFAPQTLKQKVINFINPSAHYYKLESKVIDIDLYLQNLAHEHFGFHEIMITNALGVDVKVRRPYRAGL